MPPRESYRSDVELLIMDPKSNGTGDDAKPPAPSCTDDMDTIDVEKHSSTGGSIFLNEDVANLAWHDLTVTVADRTTGEDRNILNKSSGIVRPGQMMALMGPSGSGKT